MEFSLDKFYKLNRRILIWAALFFVIWLLKDFFGLIFMTFVLAFVAQPLIGWLQARLHMPRRLATIGAHLLFLCTLVLFGLLIAPRVGREATLMIGNIPDLELKLIALKSEVVRDYPMLEESIPTYLTSALSEGGGANGLEKNFKQEFNVALSRQRSALGLTEEDVLMRDDIPATDTAKLRLLGEHDRRRDEILIRTVLDQQLALLTHQLPGVLNFIYVATVTLLLALLFSFLISMDLVRLESEVRSLSNSRLRDFYNQTAKPVVRFAYIVGRAIQAQAMIAMVNTALTVAGLWLLGVPSLVMLSFIVFFCSFIPVLGVFLSTTPMVVVALNSGGFALAIGVVAMVIAIHFIEAYLLNPLIYGQHFKINPVLVLIILFIGHHAFGIWGMILGVPVTYYFIHDVFGVPVWGEKRLATPRSPKPDDVIPPDELGARVESDE